LSKLSDSSVSYNPHSSKIIVSKFEKYQYDRVKPSTYKKQKTIEVSKCSIFNFSQPDIDDQFIEPEMEMINSEDIEDRKRDK